MENWQLPVQTPANVIVESGRPQPFNVRHLFVLLLKPTGRYGNPEVESQPFVQHNTCCSSLQAWRLLVKDELYGYAFGSIQYSLWGSHFIRVKHKPPYSEQVEVSQLFFNEHYRLWQASNVGILLTTRWLNPSLNKALSNGT